jgi:hypothetical protein
LPAPPRRISPACSQPVPTTAKAAIVPQTMRDGRADDLDETGRDFMRFGPKVRDRKQVVND